MQETWNKKIVSLTEWVSQLALLNLTWLFTSLPILTLPASTHTLFSCVKKLNRGEKVNLKKQFCVQVWRQSKERLKHDFLIWLIGCVLGFNSWFLLTSGGIPVFLQIILGAHLFLVLVYIPFFFLYYSLAQEKKSGTKETVLLALFLVLKKPLQSFGLLFSCVCLLIFFLFFPALSFFFSLSFPVWLTTVLLEK